MVEDKGMLYQGKKLLVLAELREELVKRIHEALAHGHQRVTATLKQVQRYYTCPKMKT